MILKTKHDLKTFQNRNLQYRIETEELIHGQAIATFERQSQLKSVSSNLYE